MMTKKHFSLTEDQIKAIVEDLTVFCQTQNPRFDEQRFVAACMKGGDQ